MAGLTWYTLGLVHYSRREFDDALQAEERAIGILQPLDYPSYLRCALQNHAWTLALTGRAADARRCLAEAEPLSQEGDAFWVQQIGWGNLAVAEGQHDKALTITTGILRAADHQQMPKHILSRAAWIGGRAQFALKHTEEAIFLAQASQQWGIDANDFRCISDAVALLRECLAERRRRDLRCAD
ncbi:MAG TPA: hypothetical protein VGK74_11565 [Symbiobacteriaceae bacterium]|jgi:tetratricopeptide (TPR) repeat protein